MASSASSSSTTLKSISESLNQIEPKKSSLKKAFDDLQSHSSLLSNFSLSWSDLDAHFSAVQASLAEKFRDLESLASSSATAAAASSAAKPESSARPELVALCEGMDGPGLRKYVSVTAKDRNAVREELPSAVRRAPDAAAMVLRAMEGFYGGGESDLELSSLRRSCVLLLEVLMAVGASVAGETREKAAALAAEWRRKMSKDDESALEALGFLHLVAAFGLESEIDSEEVVDCLVVVAKYRQAIELCRRIGLSDKVEELVQKLISKGKHILAVKFVFEFGLTEKFPPVPLLKAHIKESKKTAKRVCKEGHNSLKALNEATAKEVSALRSVVKVIEDQKLESEYSPEFLVKRIEELEKQRVERKRPPPPATFAPKPSQPQKQQNGNKRPRMDAHSGPKPVPKTFNQQSHFRRTGLSADGPAPYAGPSTAPPYGMPGLGPSTGIYGLVGTPTQVGVPRNAGVASSHLHSVEPYTPSNYYERPNSFGGYGLPPQYPPSYYPQ